MDIPLQELIDFCVQQKFFIVVQKEKNGVTVSYPKNIVTSPTFSARVDVYSTSFKQIEYATSDGYIQKIKTNGYDNRVLILTDIVIKAKQRQISAKLILPFDGLEPKPGIVGLINPCKNKELKKKEDKLIEKYIEIINIKNGNYTLEDATKDNIAEAFHSVRTLLEVGGF